MKKFTTDLVKQFSYNPTTGKFGAPKVIIAEELPSIDHVSRRLALRHRSRNGAALATGVQVGIGGPEAIGGEPE